MENSDTEVSAGQPTSLPDIFKRFVEGMSTHINMTPEVFHDWVEAAMRLGRELERYNSNANR